MSNEEFDALYCGFFGLLARLCCGACVVFSNSASWFVLKRWVEGPDELKPSKTAQSCLPYYCQLALRLK